MPGKTIPDLSVLPEKPKSIKHFSSCVGSKNNYSVIYYCKKKSFISSKMSEKKKKAFKFYVFVAVGGFELDGLNDSLCAYV